MLNVIYHQMHSLIYSYSHPLVRACVILHRMTIYIDATDRFRAVPVLVPAPNHTKWSPKN